MFRATPVSEYDPQNRSDFVSIGVGVGLKVGVGVRVGVGLGLHDEPEQPYGQYSPFQPVPSLAHVSNSFELQRVEFGVQTLARHDPPLQPPSHLSVLS